MNINTHSITTGEINDDESFEFDFPPSDVIEPLTFIKDDTLIVAYLSQDDDMANPLTEWDGIGNIFSTHRNAGKDQHEAFLTALGLDEYGQRDEDLPVDPYAVRLDCYQHSGTAWAVSGSAIARNFPDQQFDVGHGVGVWLPDDDVNQECDSRAEVYALFEITESTERVVGELVTKYSINSESFTDWRQAFDAAKILLKESTDNGIVPTLEQIEKGKMLAKNELAAQACDTYNQWSNGETYGIVIATYTKQDDEWTVDDSDECWGYLGTEYAISEVKSQFKDACDRLELDNSPK